MFWHRHRGYTGVTQRGDDGRYYGSVEGQAITYEADTLAGAELTFQACIDDLLDG